MTKTAKRPRAWWHYFLPPVLATLTIVAVFDVYHPFAPVGDDLLQVGGFEGASFDAQPRLTKWRGWGARARWDASAGWKGSAGLVLESEGRHHGSIAVEIEDPGRFQALTFSGRIRSEGARAGTEDWLRPRYVLYFRDGDDKPRWDYPHGVCFVRETQDWTFCRESFVVPAFAKKAVVVGQNAGTAGRVFLDDMELRPAERRASATWVLVVTALIWTLGFGVPIAWSRLWTRRFGLTTLLVALAIVAGVTAPANVMTEILRGIDDGASVVRSFWRSSPRSNPPRAHRPGRCAAGARGGPHPAGDLWLLGPTGCSARTGSERR
ncbi:MAG: hypothetical protein HC882_03870 [Acidobacteria bacterium]|nr:hypothetical protein [Acidobacteriota bacterium]